MICWCALLSLPALVPLTRPGFFETPDGLFHAWRLAALDRAVRSGVPYPRWFPEFAFGYGHPVLNFYSPLSYYWGLPFTLLGADPFVALKLAFATGLIASACGMYLFARLYLDRGPALVASVMYAYLPYHLVELYVRAAPSGLVAFVWLPLILWSFSRVSERPCLSRVALAALLVAALVVTHHVSALLFAPLLVGYALVLSSSHRPRRAAGRALLIMAAASVLALALSAFYWLPPLAESHWVGLATSTTREYLDFLLPFVDAVSLSPAYIYTTGLPDKLVFPVGLVEAVVLAAAMFLPFRLRERWRPILFFLLCGLVSAFMLTTASRPVWEVFGPVLAFLEFPWRFCTLLVLATAFLAGALVQGVTRRFGARTAFGGLLVLATAGWALSRLPFMPISPDASVEAMWKFDRGWGVEGTMWEHEFLPVWVKEQPRAISLPAPANVAGGAQMPAGRLHLTGVGYTRLDLTLDSPLPTRVAVHQFYYPGWQARWQGSVQPAHPEGVLGLAAFDLPAGTGSLTLRLGYTTAQKLGTLLSLCAFLVCGAALLLRRTGRHRLALGGCFLLPAVVLGISLAWPNGRMRPTSAIEANLEDRVELLAYTTDQARYRPGDTMEVTLYWQALASMDQDYRSFVHFTDGTGSRRPAQHDGDPGGSYTPTTRWMAGEIVPDGHTLELPSDLAPGRYLLWGGMYEAETVRNLAVLSTATRAADDRVLLGEIEVIAP